MTMLKEEELLWKKESQILKEIKLFIF